METDYQNAFELLPELEEFLYKEDEDEFFVDYFLKNNYRCKIVWNKGKQKLYFYIDSKGVGQITLSDLYELCPKGMQEIIIYHMDLFKPAERHY